MPDKESEDAILTAIRLEMDAEEAMQNAESNLQTARLAHTDAVNARRELQLSDRAARREEAAEAEVQPV